MKNKVKQLSLFALLLIAGLFLHNQRVEAATITVAGSCSLNEALQSVDDGADAGDCVADTETYGYGTNDTVSIPSQTIMLTEDLPIVEDKEISIIGAGSSSTFINGGDNEFSGFFITSGAHNISISGLTFQNSNANKAITLSGVDCDVNDIIMVNNMQNMSVNCSGHSTVEYVNVLGAMNISGSALYMNGGGSGSAVLSNIRLHENISDNTDKGVLGLQNFETLDVNNVEIADNSCATSCFFGGLFYSASSDEQEFTLRNATITNNEASIGGAWLASVGGPIIVENVTIANNRGMPGGPLEVGGVVTPGIPGGVTFENVLLDNNTISTEEESNCFTEMVEGFGVMPGPLSLGHNLSSDDTCRDSFSELGDMNSMDPKLDSLANIGGFTSVLRLQSTSPAIDTGAVISEITEDQSGIARSKCEGYDIGASEYDGCPSEGSVGDTEGFNDAVTDNYAQINTSGPSEIDEISSIVMPEDHADTGRSYPLGLVSFELNVPIGGSVTVNLGHLTDIQADDTTVRKYDSASHTYSDVDDAAVIDGLAGGVGPHVLFAAYQLTDGGPLDQDGEVNGTIVDPVGLAVLGASTPDSGGGSGTGGGGNSSGGSQQGNLGSTGQQITIISVAALVTGTVAAKRLMSRRQRKVRFKVNT